MASEKPTGSVSHTAYFLLQVFLSPSLLPVLPFLGTEPSAFACYAVPVTITPFPLSVSASCWIVQTCYELMILLSQPCRQLDFNRVILCQVSWVSLCQGIKWSSMLGNREHQTLSSLVTTYLLCVPMATSTIMTRSPDPSPQAQLLPVPLTDSQCQRGTEVSYRIQV